MTHWIRTLLPGTATLLTAPPAWGKTSMLIELFQQKSASVLYIAPLRALAEEFNQSLQGKKGVAYLSTEGNGADSWSSFYKKESHFLITTPEKLTREMLESLEEMEPSPIVIWDEFHLNFSWGFDFRPILWEVFMGIPHSACAFLGLSATMSDQVMRTFVEQAKESFDFFFHINCGNFKFRFSPSHSFFFSSDQKKILDRVFKKAVLGKGKSLYFCRTKREVDTWLEWAEWVGLSAIGAKGGEVPRFREESERVDPQIIFSTSVLGHGVNLPSIRRVFISYHLEQKEFWLQMASRGGRRGENFWVYSMNSYGVKWYWREWQRFKNTFTQGMMPFYAEKNRRSSDLQNSLSRTPSYWDTFIALGKESFGALSRWTGRWLQEKVLYFRAWFYAKNRPESKPPRK